MNVKSKLSEADLLDEVVGYFEPDVAVTVTVYFWATGLTGASSLSYEKVNVLSALLIAESLFPSPSVNDVSL